VRRGTVAVRAKRGAREKSIVPARRPEIRVFNRQRLVRRIDLAWLRLFARLALEACVDRFKMRRRGVVLGEFEEIEVTLVSDRTMARLHSEFMKIDGPTDVLTFQHGEIVISAEAARTNALRFRTGLTREIALYTVHGLLHLNGLEDATARGAAQMCAIQNRILNAILAQLPPPSRL
jgi:probable rRNA maturation factor